MWVGPECTVNRVGDAYRDQLETTGFAHRLDDLDRIASLGAKRIRFPVLWERAERAPGDYDFSWPDSCLERLRQLGVKPIAGLLHHGSGPRHTSLVDPLFPEKLAAYAAEVARRYPWIDAYTPVNEPLTTARFSGLYGLWYPHERSDAAFVRAVVQQVRGIALAMRAVREVNPQAQLVLTEDHGHTTGTDELVEQITFENHRRWLVHDLLVGRVDSSHPLWKYLVKWGIDPSELEALAQDPTPPDVIGVNFYVTSERFLDHRLERYPARLHGGNGKQAYVDVEAVRVLGAPIGGFKVRLRETARRYGLPLAITEVHLGCSREEQMRWLLEGWTAARELAEEGVDVRGVTCWAAFGSCDWDSLLTRERGHYEPGLWDVRGPEPRPTALARLARDLAAGRTPDHPGLQAPGWWHRDVRHEYEPHGEVSVAEGSGTPVLIVGARGTLGQAFARLCHLRGLPYRLLSRDDMDITSSASVRQALERWQPWAVINTAGYVEVDKAEADPRQWHDNAYGPIMLGRQCADAGVRLLSFSSDLVFDGVSQSPYRESDPARPLNAYGRAKLMAEQALLEMPGALVVRTAAFFGPWDRYNFLTRGLQQLERGECWTAVDDQVVSPTYVPHLVNVCLDLLIDGEEGLWHVANRGSMSWHRFACHAAEAAGFSTALVKAVQSHTLALPARRPAFSALCSERGELTPQLDAAIQHYIEQAPWRGDAVEPPLREFGLVPCEAKALSALAL